MFLLGYRVCLNDNERIEAREVWTDEQRQAYFEIKRPRVDTEPTPKNKVVIKAATPPRRR